MSQSPGHPDLARRLTVLTVLMEPAIQAASKAIKLAYANTDDAAYLEAMHAASFQLESELSEVLGTGISQQQILRLCTGKDTSESRERWCRLLSILAAFRALQK